MKKSRFIETMIVGILKEAESGIAMADILRTHSFSPNLEPTTSVTLQTTTRIGLWV
jgi:hypothetical protein